MQTPASIRAKKKYYLKNRAEVIARSKTYSLAHPEKVSAYKKKYAEIYRDRTRASVRRHYKVHKAKILAKARADRANPYLDAGILANLRSRVYIAVRRAAAYKSAKTIDLLSCTPVELKEWLALQFEPGMNWENYGEWHIDHIRPCKSFDLKDPEQQKVCFHYTNLQPLWAAENLSKGARI